jgi:hypothetical protein
MLGTAAIASSRIDASAAGVSSAALNGNPETEIQELPLMSGTGLVLSWLVTLFCLFDGGARLAGFAPTWKACARSATPQRWRPGSGSASSSLPFHMRFHVPRCWAPSC